MKTYTHPPLHSSCQTIHGQTIRFLFSFRSTRRTRRRATRSCGTFSATTTLRRLSTYSTRRHRRSRCCSILMRQGRAPLLFLQRGRCRVLRGSRARCLHGRQARLRTCCGSAGRRRRAGLRAKTCVSWQKRLLSGTSSCGRWWRIQTGYSMSRVLWMVFLGMVGVSLYPLPNCLQISNQEL